MASVIRHPAIDRSVVPVPVPGGPAAVRAAASSGPPAPARNRRALWREAVGAFLRRERLAQGRILADVARDAGVSIQYLSEVERGRKEPSSEVLGAVGAALGFDLVDLTAGVAAMLAREQAAAPGRRVLVLPSSTDVPAIGSPSGTGFDASREPVAGHGAPTALVLALAA